jgi:hypothetical protein
MKLFELKEFLAKHAEQNLRLLLPDGRPIQADFHVTEIGHVSKRFIDCGGVTHSHEACVLQVWVARNDADHRLKAQKLASILDVAKSVVSKDELDVEVEYEDAAISQYVVASFEREPAGLVFKLAAKHTDCLAREACGLESLCCADDCGP